MNETAAAFDALASIPEESVLTQVLLHHVVSGNVRSEDLTDGIMPATLEGAVRSGQHCATQILAERASHQP